MLKRSNFDDTCVFDQNIDLAKAIDDSPNSRLNLSGVEQIAFNCEDLATAWRKISLCTRQFLIIPRNESNVAASRADMSREHKSESARTTGDQDNLFAQRITRGVNKPRDYPGAK